VWARRVLRALKDSPRSLASRRSNRRKCTRSGAECCCRDLGISNALKASPRPSALQQSTVQQTQSCLSYSIEHSIEMQKFLGLCRPRCPPPHHATGWRGQSRIKMRHVQKMRQTLHTDACCRRMLLPARFQQCAVTRSTSMACPRQPRPEHLSQHVCSTNVQGELRGRANWRHLYQLIVPRPPQLYHLWS